MKAMLNLVALMLRGVRIYALIGKAGTGKSFRARSLAEKYDIDLIIDDGLLIRGGRVLGGRSAKKESNAFTATKTSIFEDREHRREVAESLRTERFSSLLILGTSEKMILRIMGRLGIGPLGIHKTIHIESIASQQEIAAARKQRVLKGTHVVPVPTLEVKTRPAFKIIDSLRTLLHRHQILYLSDKVIEQSIVYPSYSERGKLAISDAAIRQMIFHCLQEFSPKIQMRKALIFRSDRAYDVEIGLSFPIGLSAPETLSDLQKFLKGRMERYAGISDMVFHLTLEQVRGAQSIGPHPVPELRAPRRESKADGSHKADKYSAASFAKVIGYAWQSLGKGGTQGKAGIGSGFKRYGRR